jgi:hypothetical protein
MYFKRLILSAAHGHHLTHAAPPRLNAARHLHKAHYVCRFKNPFHPFAIEVGERTSIWRYNISAG